MFSCLEFIQIFLGSVLQNLEIIPTILIKTDKILGSMSKVTEVALSDFEVTLIKNVSLLFRNHMTSWWRMMRLWAKKKKPSFVKTSHWVS